MPHLLLELLIWVLIAFFVGCLLGYLLRMMFGAKPEVAQPVTVVSPKPMAKPVSELPPPPPLPPAVPLPAMPPTPLASPAPQRPKGIAKARDDKPDDLQRISGIGPVNEKVLHGLGTYHFDQIAAWTADEVQWVDDHLKFNGRIAREEWIRQARLLAKGDEEEFAKLYGTGGLRDRKTGETKSGTRTRRK